MGLNQPELHMGNEMTIDMVREIVREELAKRCDVKNIVMPSTTTLDKSTLSKYAETIKETVKANKNKETK